MASVLEKLIDEAFGVVTRPPTAIAPSAVKPAPAGTVPASGPQAKTGPAGKVNPIRITSPYGWRIHPVTKQHSHHHGTDVAGKIGDPVFAIAQGVVSSVRTSGTAGLYIVINHGNGVESKYMHLSAYSVKAGQKVAAGQRIGSVGKSGRVTGPHLHLEVWVNGAHVRPTPHQAAIASGKPILGST